MSTNSFYCKKCKKFTRHIELTWREYDSLKGEGFWAQAFDVAWYLSGAEKLGKEISGARPYGNVVNVVELFV